jgi:hypothetical protein
MEAEAMQSERNGASKQAASVVMVWTPWGEQVVPRSESRSKSLRRMADRRREEQVQAAPEASLN